MKIIIEPALFDILIEYAGSIDPDEVIASNGRGLTSNALTFCENFYLQFFENRLGSRIKRIDFNSKKTASGLAIDLKRKKTDKCIIELITWFETLCDRQSTILALSYGAGGLEAFVDFHENYLPTLLGRILAWANYEKLTDVEQKAKAALTALSNAMERFKL